MRHLYSDKKGLTFFPDSGKAASAVNGRIFGQAGVRRNINVGRDQKLEAIKRRAFQAKLTPYV
jgi:hypothetical protein